MSYSCHTIVTTQSLAKGGVPQQEGERAEREEVKTWAGGNPGIWVPTVRLSRKRQLEGINDDVSRLRNERNPGGRVVSH